MSDVSPRRRGHSLCSRLGSTTSTSETGANGAWRSAANDNNWWEADSRLFLKLNLKRYTGKMSLDRFIALWTHPDSAPDSVSEDELESAEGRLGTRLPADYRRAVLQVGLPRPTIALLDAIVDRELDLSDVSEFLSPAELVSVTEDWRDLGLPEELVAFATDCMGNLFCFPTAADAAGPVPVLFFNHDDQTVDVIAPSFTQWIEEFCGVQPH